jgi:hypothetical protein
MIKLILLGFLLTQLTLGEVQIIDRVKDLRYKHYETWWNRTKIVAKNLPGGWHPIEDPSTFLSQNGHIVGESVQAV